MDPIQTVAISRKEEYDKLLKDLAAVTYGETFLPSVLSTIACLIYRQLTGIYWSGFYLEHEGVLKVGPYQGTLGCITIAPERGVCGRAYRTKQVQIVGNVHDDPEHIACDAASLSEIVIPVFRPDGSVFAVLDVDSAAENRFDEVDAKYLQEMIRSLVEPLLKGHTGWK